MKPLHQRKSRRGYAMMLVVVFLVVVLSMIGETFRQAATTLRVEASRSRRVACDEGSMTAASWAIKYLEDGNVPVESVPYSNYGYQIVFAKVAGDPADPSGSQRWAIQVVPTP